MFELKGGGTTTILGGGPLMTTTALALRESLAQESGVGTLSIIHNLHLVYIQN